MPEEKFGPVTEDEAREILCRAIELEELRRNLLTSDQLRAMAAELGVSEESLRQAREEANARRDHSPRIRSFSGVTGLAILWVAIGLWCMFWPPIPFAGYLFGVINCGVAAALIGWSGRRLRTIFGLTIVCVVLTWLTAFAVQGWPVNLNGSSELLLLAGTVAVGVQLIRRRTDAERARTGGASLNPPRRRRRKPAAGEDTLRNRPLPMVSFS